MTTNTNVTYTARDGKVFETEGECCLYEMTTLRCRDLAKFLWGSALETYSEECLIAGYFGWYGSSDDVILIAPTEENLAALRELWNLIYETHLDYEPSGDLLFLQGVADGYNYGRLAFYEAGTVTAELAMELQTLEAEVARNAEVCDCYEIKEDK